jgi:hypothetical protein
MTDDARRAREKNELTTGALALAPEQAERKMKRAR